LAAEVVGIEDRLHVPQAVAGDGGDLQHRATCQRQPRDGGSPATTRLLPS
jgi:hypothetical protein